jgi:hypothetical protein
MVDNTTASTTTVGKVAGGPKKEDVMRRNEVLSLLERFPELVDGDDDLLRDLIVEAGPEPPETEDKRAGGHSDRNADSPDRLAKWPR